MIAEPRIDREAERQDRRGTALQAARRIDANQVPHQEPRIAGASVHQHAFENVAMPAQVHAPHPPSPLFRIDVRSSARDDVARIIVLTADLDDLAHSSILLMPRGAPTNHSRIANEYGRWRASRTPARTQSSSASRRSAPPPIGGSLLGQADPPA